MGHIWPMYTPCTRPITVRYIYICPINAQRYIQVYLYLFSNVTVKELELIGILIRGLCAPTGGFRS